jgi:hypothetical protein
MTRRETEAETKAVVDRLCVEIEARLGGPVARPVVRPEVRPAARPDPFKYSSHGNGELMQLIVGIPFGILAVYITIKIISFFL